MKPRDVLDMLLIGAIWGGAFPMLRVAAPAFGPVALIGVRVAIAAVVLLALLRARGELVARARPLFVLAMLNTAIPFTLFAYASLGVTAGTASLLNATTPMFGALLAYLWLGERLGALQVLGIALGFGGIALIVWQGVGAQGPGAGLAVAAGLAGAALYGAAASYARRRLAGADALVVATGCVCGAVLVMVPAAALTWPEQSPGALAWGCAAGLGLVLLMLGHGQAPQTQRQQRGHLEQAGQRGMALEHGDGRGARAGGLLARPEQAQAQPGGGGIAARGQALLQLGLAVLPLAGRMQQLQPLARLPDSLRPATEVYRLGSSDFLFDCNLRSGCGD